MTEALGAAGSIVGIVGLAGQLGSGCLKVKGFLDDAKSAPKDIRALYAEMEILGAEAERMKVMLPGMNPSPQVSQNCKRALDQCFNAVAGLGKKIENDVQRIGGLGKISWWDRTKAAARRKSVAEDLVRVERAKTQLMMVMQGLASRRRVRNDQREQREVIQEGFTVACGQREAILDLASRANEKLAVIETGEQSIRERTVRTNALLESFNEQWLSSTSQGHETMREVQSNLTNLHAEINALPSAIHFLLKSVLVEHQAEVSHQQEKNKEAAPRIVEVEDNMMSHELQKPRPWSSKSGSDSHTITRRSKILHRRKFRTPFFSIEITTSEYQFKNIEDTSDWSLGTHTKQITTYNILLRKTGLLYRSGNPATFYDPGIHRLFRTYNIVPRDAPIWKACDKFDHLGVRRLFEAGLASPFDQNERGDSLAQSVIDNIWSTCFNPTVIRPQLPEGVTLLRLIVEFAGGQLGRVHGCWQILHYFNAIFSRDELKQVPSQATEALRIIMAYTSEDPFEGDSVGHYLNQELKQTSLYGVLVGQQKWDIDMNPKNSFPEQFKNCYVENDIMMLEDATGSKVKGALARGLFYIPYEPYQIDWSAYEDSMYSPLHFLLQFASVAREFEDMEIRECCLRRLVLLLDSGHKSCDPHYRCPFPWRFRGLRVENPPCLEVSPTDIAIRYGVVEIWKDSLERVGWSASDVRDLFDEATYAGVPELLNGELTSTTLEEQCRDFIEALRMGEFMDAGDRESRRWFVEKCFYLGLEPPLYASILLKKIVGEVSTCFKQRATPGNWPDTESVKLMPGVDFSVQDFARSSSRGQGIWKCFLDIWQDELGYIPPGYEEYYRYTMDMMKSTDGESDAEELEYQYEKNYVEESHDEGEVRSDDEAPVDFLDALD